MLKKGATIPMNKHNQLTQKPVYILTENEYNNLVKRAQYNLEDKCLKEKLLYIEKENKLLNRIQELESQVSNQKLMVIELKESLEDTIKELKESE